MMLPLTGLFLGVVEEINIRGMRDYRVCLHLGSNMDNRLDLLRQAVTHLGEYVLVIEQSAIYETAAWGFTDQPDFYNVALLAYTRLHPFALLDFCQSVEAQIGRGKTQYWGPRRIDIDILYVDDLIVQTQRLTLPHPRLHIRNFVLYPLNDVDGLFKHPIFGRSCADLLSACVDTTIVRRIDETL